MIPAHNSEGVIEGTVDAFAHYLSDRKAEIIVVENGSTDGTAAVCDRLAASWTHRDVLLRVLSSDKGMGNALKLGVSRSSGDQVLLTADDLPFGFDDLDAARDFADTTGAVPLVAIGSKAHPESQVERGIRRATMTLGFALLRRVVLGTRTKDPQGTFLVQGRLARNLMPHLVEAGFLFTTELDYAVELAGVRPVELPVRLSEEHRAQPSRVSSADVRQMGRGLLELRRRRAVLRSAALASM